MRVMWAHIRILSSALRKRNGFRHYNAVPGVQLSGLAPGGSPRHPVLRSVPGAGRSTHDAAFDPGEVETVGTADDQCARPRAGHGSNDAGTDDAAAGA